MLVAITIIAVIIAAITVIAVIIVIVININTTAHVGMNAEEVADVQDVKKQTAHTTHFLKVVCQ